MCVLCELGGRGFQLDLDKDPIGDSGAPKGGTLAESGAASPGLAAEGVSAAIAAASAAAEDLPRWFQATYDGSDTAKNEGPDGDTVPANTSTPFSLTVGGPAEVGYINTNTDRDWYAVELVAGQYYEFTMDPGTGLDAVLQLRNSNGQIVGSADSPDAAATETLGFYATTSGTYYVVADGYQTTKGQYSLSVDTAPLPSPLEAIDWGGSSVANPEVILVYFANAGEVFDGVSSLGWNSYEIQQAMLAFEQYENIIDVEFQITTNSAEADFKLVTTNSSSYLGYFNPPGTPGAGIGVFARNGTGWDEAGGGGLEQGGYGFITMIHEFGHGMGLAHPHDSGGGSEVMLGVTGSFGSYGLFDMNQGIYTTMSYNDGWQTGPNGESPSVLYGYQGTMMALDIAVLQDKYGANTTFNNTNTNYNLSTTNAAGTYYSSIWDTGGNDTISYAGSAAAFIDLRAATLEYSEIGAGAVSYVTGIYGGFTIANGVVIENASGGSGVDTITGNDAANNLSGNAGNDIINGGLGNDTITGGIGNDTLDGGGGNDTFVFGSGHGNDTINGFVAGGSEDTIQVTGYASYTLVQEGANLRIVFDASNSILLNNVNAASFTAADINIPLAGDGVINGTEGADTLDGTPDADEINGLGGNDTINGLGGDDIIDGGSGDDVINGGTGADTMTGGTGNDWFYVDNAGDIVIEAGGGGVADRVFASVSYILTAGAAIETLSTTFQAGTGAINLTGNELGQTIVGNDGTNTLNGAGGDDSLYGHGGDDILIGGSGADLLDGGLGFDTADYSGAASAVTVNLLLQSATGGAGADTVRDVERVIGSGFNDTLRGNGVANTLEGGAGDDILDGFQGADTMIGGLGSDWYHVDDAGDVIVESDGQGVLDRAFASASYVLAAGVSIEILSTNLQAGTAAINLTGNEFGQAVVGNNGDNTLDGGAGDDTIYGHNGNDTLIGGLGNDRLDGGLGVDLVDYSGASGAVTANLLTQSSSGAAGNDILLDIEQVMGSAFNDVITGNALGNLLDGGAGDDRLDGRGGVDTTIGGLGNDWHYVDNAADVVIELAGQGAADRVFASASYTLDAAAEIEIFSTTLQAGTSAINLTGNGFSQSVVGNDGANQLDGAGGNDTLYGHGGADTLIGGAGDDLMYGGAGNDTFLYNAGLFGNDMIVDFANGSDMISVQGIAGADDFGDLAVSTNGSGYAVITFPDGSTITLVGVAAGQVDAGDFVFGP